MQTSTTTEKRSLFSWWDLGENLIDISDYQALAKRRLPKFLFDFLEGDAEDGFARSNNAQSLNSVQLMPQRLVDVGEVQTKVDYWQERASMPLVLAPTALTRMFHHQGELAVACAAEKQSVPYVLSTMSSVALEDVYAANPNTWFQLYAYRDRAISQRLIQRVVEQQGRVLCVTLDAFEGGNRQADRRNGLRLPFKASLKHITDAARRPKWSADYLRGEPINLANMKEVQAQADGTSLFEYVASQMNPSLTWDDIHWIRDSFPGTVILKGLLHPQDVLKAKALGVDGVVLSNHGGRQLDHSISGFQALQLLPKGLSNDIKVFIDGEIRRGTDIVKAMCLGAAGCFVGRPYLYGLAAHGQPGVEAILDILNSELVRNLKLIGCASISELNAGLVMARET
ncbi:alpha-hydroxy acid oxidase [Halioxenophilus aromaticivorans]|uniref:Alpha-hydroxy acid oxidase n=1 Tax=Halioxenophilus aromaticivorans TaxID=1306992 RepID=A0AAV3TXT2_9ALTE